MENNGGKELPGVCEDCCYKDIPSCRGSSKHRCTNERARVLFNHDTHHWECHSFQKYYIPRLRLGVSL